MTEQQLREKLQFAYGNMPDATRAAFEHSLTHHRAPETHRSIGLNRTMRIVITAVLMALMLTAVGVAAARFFSVTDVHPAQDGTEGDYQAHYLALEERYDSDLLSVSVNDVVYDGSVLAFTMEMAAKTDDVLAVEVRICGECDGKMYRFDPLDVYGGEFQSLLMLPDLGGTFDGEKYAAEGILLDENGQMPPEGKPIAWTIEIDVLKAVWQTETMPDDLYEALSEEDDVAQYIREQAEQHMITLTDAGVEDYLLEMCGVGWDEIEQMSKADLLLRCGGFERVETYTVAFATEGNTQYVHPELSGLRIPLDGYTAVVDYVRASFLGGCVVLHCEAPEGTALPNGTALPDVWRIYRNDEQNPAGEAGWARASGYAGVPGGVVDVNQPSICLYFAPCADLTSLRIVPEGEAGFTLNLSGEKGTE